LYGRERVPSVVGQSREVEEKREVPLVAPVAAVGWTSRDFFTSPLPPKVCKPAEQGLVLFFAADLHLRPTHVIRRVTGPERGTQSHR
jgi:hypothetical protein